METDESNLATGDMMDEACAFIKSCPEVIRTPTLKHAQTFLQGQSDSLSDVELTLKMENFQNTGSFKIRGLVNQWRFLPNEVLSGETNVVTMSAGNYGKAYGYLLHQRGVSGVCLMPLTAPISRVNTVQGFGVEVELVPTREMVSVVNQYINQRGCHFMHSYDDINLILSYTSIGDEILEDEPDVDVVLVGCGGGALLAGIAARVKMKRPGCRVYGVEPESASSMHDSFKQKRAVTLKGATSVAGGLAPPGAGKLPYLYCQKYVEDILLVSEEEIVAAVSVLFNSRLVVEPAGCACLAALLTGKVVDMRGKKVVVVLSGGNVTMGELSKLIT